MANTISHQRCRLNENVAHSSQRLEWTPASRRTLVCLAGQDVAPRPTPRFTPRDVGTRAHKVCAGAFTAALLTMAQSWELPRCHHWGVDSPWWCWPRATSATRGPLTALSSADDSFI